MKQWARYLLTFAITILLWQLGFLLLGEGILPSPANVGLSLIREGATGEFWGHVAVSLARATSGLIFGFALAFPLGLWLGASRQADLKLAPFIFLTYPIPKILFLPVLLVMLGLGEAPKIILVALTCGYQILVVTRDSLRHLNPSYILSFKAINGAAKDKTLSRIKNLAWHVLAPAAFPAAISALRLAAGTAVAVLFMAESFATERGLGFMIMEAWGALDLPRMFGGIAAMSLMGLFLYIIIDCIERRVCRWALG